MFLFPVSKNAFNIVFTLSNLFCSIGENLAMSRTKLRNGKRSFLKNH